MWRLRRRLRRLVDEPVPIEMSNPRHLIYFNGGRKMLEVAVDLYNPNDERVFGNFNCHIQREPACGGYVQNTAIKPYDVSAQQYRALTWTYKANTGSWLEGKSYDYRVRDFSDPDVVGRQLEGVIRFQ